MADFTVKLEGMDRAWIKAALQVQRAVLVRGRAKEMDGSEIYALRSKEIAAVDALLVKF